MNGEQIEHCGHRQSTTAAGIRVCVPGSLPSTAPGGDPTKPREQEAWEALAATCTEPGRYVVLCDDGSVIATDDLMADDHVIHDRGEDWR